MGVLQRFEKRLENLVEGAFARVFKGVVHPVEIASAMQREADAHKTILGGGRTLVPNRYVIDLSPGDHDQLAQYAAPLAQELAQAQAEFIGEQGWMVYGDVIVEIERGDGLDTGMFRVAAEVYTGGIESQPPPHQAPQQQWQQDQPGYNGYEQQQVSGPGGQYGQPSAPPAPDPYQYGQPTPASYGGAGADQYGQRNDPYGQPQHHQDPGQPYGGQPQSHTDYPPQQRDPYDDRHNDPYSAPPAGGPVSGSGYSGSSPGYGGGAPMAAPGYGPPPTAPFPGGSTAPVPGLGGMSPTSGAGPRPVSAGGVPSAPPGSGMRQARVIAADGRQFAVSPARPSLGEARAHKCGLPTSVSLVSMPASTSTGGVLSLLTWAPLMAPQSMAIASMRSRCNTET